MGRVIKMSSRLLVKSRNRPLFEMLSGNEWGSFRHWSFSVTFCNDVSILLFYVHPYIHLILIVCSCSLSLNYCYSFLPVCVFVFFSLSLRQCHVCKQFPLSLSVSLSNSISNVTMSCVSLFVFLFPPWGKNVNVCYSPEYLSCIGYWGNVEMNVKCGGFICTTHQKFLNTP